jgi:hypothetical protein
MAFLLMKTTALLRLTAAAFTALIGGGQNLFNRWGQARKALPPRGAPERRAKLVNALQIFCAQPCAAMGNASR